MITSKSARYFSCFGRQGFMLLSAAVISSASAADSTFPSDENKFIGDHLRLRTNVDGFIEVSGDQSKKFCAPVSSRVAVTGETSDELFVRFLDITDEADSLLNDVDKAGLAACPKKDAKDAKDGRRVNGFTQYKIKRTTIGEHDFKRSGVTFGGLLVPFKYRLGSSKELVSSATMAPFVGFRTAWFQNWGLTFTPVLSAGLSLVPVADAASNSTSTKAAYTLAAGVRLTSSKNEAFSAGVLFGRDFLNKADRAMDASVNKPWASFYVGFAI